MGLRVAMSVLNILLAAKHNILIFKEYNCVNVCCSIVTKN